MSIKTGWFIWAVCLAVPAATVRAAQPEHFTVKLEEARRQTLENSFAVQAAEFVLRAARDQARATGAVLYPRVDLTGNYSYQTHVPLQTLGPGPAVRFGDHHNYSLGPAANYTAFDGSRARNEAQSARLSAQAKEQDWIWQKRTVRHSVDLTYARLQFCAAHLALTLDAFKLAQQQSADIELRYKVGSASRLDRLSADKEKLNYQLLFYEAQNDLAQAWRDLCALMLVRSAPGAQRPVPEEIAKKFPREIESPTLILSIETFEETLDILGRDPVAEPDESTPQLKSLTLSAQSLQAAALSQSRANWPSLQLAAESRWAYPDMAKLESYQNNIFSARLAFPLWDAQRNRGLAERLGAESKAQEKRQKQTELNLMRDHLKALDAVQSLQMQLQVSRRCEREAEEIARLTYSSYEAGKTTFLEVQTANLKWMQARAVTVRVQFELAAQLAEMEYLSGSQARTQNNRQ